MIRVKRLPLPAEEAAGLSTWQQRLTGCQPCDDRIQAEWERFRREPLRHQVVRALNRQTRRKCVYCEKKGARTIDHYRPKRLFPHLTFAWENFNWACTDCNFHKGPWLPSPDGRPLLFNPMDEMVEDYFFFDLLTGAIRPKYGLSPNDEERANHTIKLLKLNNPALQDERRAVAKSILQQLKAFRQHRCRLNECLLLYVLSRRHPMSGVARQVLRSKDYRDLVAECLEHSPRVRRYIELLNWV